MELDRLQVAAEDLGMVVIVAAHPTKPSQGYTGEKAPTEYDIAGSRSFNDNSDQVWVVHRDKGSEFMYFRVAKSRDQKRGSQLGCLQLQYNKELEVYDQIEKMDHRPDCFVR